MRMRATVSDKGPCTSGIGRSSGPKVVGISLFREYQFASIQSFGENGARDLKHIWGTLMLRTTALSLVGLFFVSSSSLAQCTPEETKQVQTVFATYTNRILSGDFEGAIATLQRLNALPLTPQCQSAIAPQVQRSQPGPGAPRRPPHPSTLGLPGCVGGVCSTPDGTYKVIP